jgi:hypothetical protein
VTGALIFFGVVGTAFAKNEPYPVFGESWVSELGVAGTVQYWPQVMVPMRDGVRLSTDILLPKDARRPYPTVLVRTPYPKGGTFARGSEQRLLQELINGGYAIVVQSERGAFPSEGEYHYLSNARHDGYDTVEWIVKQPWSNGRIATYGCSSPAENQMAVSAANPPGLVAMIPKAAGAGIGHFPGTWNQGLFYDGGIPEFEFIPWYHSWAGIYRLQAPKSLSDEERSRLMQFYLQTWQNPPDMPLLPAAWHLPVKDILRTIGTPSSDWDTFIQRTPGDPAWRHEEMLTMYDHPREPALIVSSWHDIGTWPEIKEFEYEQSRAPNQFLIMGPTGHCLMGTETSHTMVGQEDVGDARFDYNAVYMQWFNHWLKGQHDGALSRPKVEYYLINASKWLTAASWPPAGVAHRLYLNSGRGANSVFGDGTLETTLPKRAGSDSYRNDPADPVPTINRYFQPDIVADQKLVAARHDVLVYTSSPLQNNLDVVGDVTANLYVSTSVKDTDLMLRLVDVFPDGRAFNVRDEVLRLRYRNGFQSPELMAPGKVYSINLQGIVTATRFGRGHRIRIEITSSNFPLLERNLNTGGDNEAGVKFDVANISIYHGGAHASYVTLPVLGNELAQASRHDPSHHVLSTH